MKEIPYYITSSESEWRNRIKQRLKNGGAIESEVNILLSLCEKHNDNSDIFEIITELREKGV